MSITGNIKNFLGCEPKLGDMVSASDWNYTIKGEITQPASEHIRLVKIKGVSVLRKEWGGVIEKEEETYMPVDKCLFL
jgi:hypothetical protein